MSMRTRGAIVSIIAALALVGAQPAGAQFPGRPGRFVGTTNGLTTFAKDGTDPTMLQLGAKLVGAGVEYPEFTPNGKAIVFDASTGSDPDYEIYRVPAGGGKAVQLTHNTATDWGAEQGPDRIVFVCTRGSNDEICTMKPDGSGIRRLTTNTDEDWDPTWTPDGSRIVFSSNRRGSHDIYSMKADGTGTRRLTDGSGDELEPDVSPDGRRIVYARNASNMLVVMRIDGTHANTLAVPSPYPSRLRTPTWSPNGKRIAFETSDQIVTRSPTDDTSAIKTVVASGAGNNIAWQSRP